jgi:Carboxypeptidase regulatory-like domain
MHTMESKKWNITTASFLLCFLMSMQAAVVRGQSVAVAQIAGVISDPSGAAVPKAHITVTQTNTNLVRTTVSGSDGTYVFPDLPVGPYRLEVTNSGFETYSQSGIELQVGSKVQINVSLKVGSLSQTVQVTSNAQMVEIQQTAVSSVVDQRRIVDLPLNGRNATQLVLLAGASEAVSSGNPNQWDLSASGGVGKVWPTEQPMSVAGGQLNGTNWVLDGADNNDAFMNVNLPYPFPDALQEFSVETNATSPRFGVHPGGVVNVVTKSGTNQFHGDAFEFLRNGDLNARNFFAATQDTLRRNQFGGTLGGPIVKDKLFFFFGYQGTRNRTAPPTSTFFVPTQAALNGDFSTLESAACQSSGKAVTLINPTTGQLTEVRARFHRSLRQASGWRTTDWR